MLDVGITQVSTGGLRIDDEKLRDHWYYARDVVGWNLDHFHLAFGVEDLFWLRSTIVLE